MDINKKVDKITEEIYKAYGTDTGILFGIKDKSAVKAVIKYAVERTVINLCDNCAQGFESCRAKQGEIIFGESIGNDNVISCKGFYDRNHT